MKVPVDHRRQAMEALQQGKLDEAIASLEKAVLETPGDPELYRAAGRFLRAAGRADEAAAWYQRCLSKFPGDAIATMGLVALGRAPAPPRLPDEVVLYVFDRNAGTYESNMRSLGYSVPEVLRDLLRADGGTEARALDVLDLGCGSGWCGPLLRPFARRLAGVDLSARMLELASEKRVYDELVQAEILEFLGRAAGVTDVVFAANVLMYFGDLDELAAALARNLRRGGRFVFDVEKGEGMTPGFHVSGRFTHSLAFLEKALQPHGFSLTQVHEAVMRVELGKPVAGLHVVARLPD